MQLTNQNPRAARLVSAVLFSALALPAASCNKSASNATAKAPTVKEGGSAPEMAAEREYYTVDDWWPNRLDLRVLKKNAPVGDPTSADFSYAEAFEKLDYSQVKKDIEQTMKDSKAWWPADWGHYGGLMIRLAWHSAGTYRVMDGRGGGARGIIRFAPLNSWPDNANLDKARRLLWPVKKKYGRSLSWADLIVLSGNVALESMGFKTFGFGAGRVDIYEPTDINWGPETEWLADKRSNKKTVIDKPFGASQMGLIYVNPEGPNGKPDPMAAAKHIRVTFARMGMNDEETVALIAGGHTLGKAHGADKGSKCLEREPAATPVENQGLGWKNKCGSGKGGDAITSGLEGAWTNTPTKWSHSYLENLYNFEWVLTESPGGAKQWTPKNGPASVPDAHDPSKRHKPMMFTTDIALKTDPAYKKITRRFLNDRKAFEEAFAKAWYKLLHRDMGPHSRLLGPEVAPPQVWQNPVPKVDHQLVTASDIAKLKKQILSSGLTTPQLVRTAWAAASTYRHTDYRGGANGARIRLAPQKTWAVNRPDELGEVISTLEGIQKTFNKSAKGGKQVSLADLIVLGGNAAIEAAAQKAGHTLTVPFTPGRTDATEEMTDTESFQHLKPEADGFRNYKADNAEKSGPELLVEKADMLRLTAPEMAVLVAGMRVLDANYDGSKHGVFTTNPGALTNDFFVNLLDMNNKWRKSQKAAGVYEAVDRKSGNVQWTGTAVDLIFGSNSQLRALSEVYAADDAKKKFTNDFAAAWHKVMMLDRFDLQR